MPRKRVSCVLTKQLENEKTKKNSCIPWRDNKFQISPRRLYSDENVLNDKKRAARQPTSISPRKNRRKSKPFHKNRILHIYLSRNLIYTPLFFYQTIPIFQPILPPPLKKMM